MVNGVDDNSACPVFDIIGNELVIHNITTTDPATYNDTAFKTYEFTFINSVITNVDLGQNNPLPSVSGGAEPYLFIVHPSNKVTNNVFWSADVPKSAETSLCGDRSAWSTVTGSCGNSSGGLELSTNGGYIGLSQDGDQYIAQLTDGYESLNYSTNLLTSNLLAQSSNHDPSSTTYTINSNADRHSVYWQVALVNSQNDVPNPGECIYKYGTLHQPSAPPLLAFAGMIVFLVAPPPPVTTPPVYEVVFWMNQTDRKINQPIPYTDQLVNGPCQNYLDSGFLNDTDSSNFLTGGRAQSEWAIYSTPSASYKAPLFPLGAHFNDTEGTKGLDGEFCCNSSAHVNGLFVNGSGDDYAFYTIGFDLG
jgi:hypothetical protein